MTISIRTARLAKKKGLGKDMRQLIPILGNFQCKCYNTDTNKIITPKIFNFNNPHVLAPDQAVLQKWLREIHDIDIEIQSFRELDGSKKYWHCVIKDELEEDDEEAELKDTYEESLEIALFEALEMIP